jgi:HSP20 family protein
MNMTRLIQYDPADIFSEFQDFFALPLMRPRAQWPLSQVSFRTDVKEKNGGYIITAELPGLKKEDIDISVEGSRVTISAKREQVEEEKEKGQVIRTERYYGDLTRTFDLNQTIDAANVKAQYRDGVLTLTLPKSASALGKHVTVQ